MDNFSSGGALRTPIISEIGRGEVEVRKTCTDIFPTRRVRRSVKLGHEHVSEPDPFREIILWTI